MLGYGKNLFSVPVFSFNVAQPKPKPERFWGFNGLKVYQVWVKPRF
jgi:hypothetical protein